MANEELKEVTKPPGGRRKGALIIIAVVLLLLVCGFFVSLQLLKPTGRLQ
jgi:HAMP domain-containing protein